MPTYSTLLAWRQARGIADRPIASESRAPYGCGRCPSRPGDRIWQLKNDYTLEVFNRNLGTVQAVEPTEQELLIALDDGRKIRYPLASLHQLTHAYTISVHKAQGAEFPAVVLPLLTSHAALLNERGYRTSGNRGRNLFTKDTVRPLLQNRFYLGELPDGNGGWRPGAHEPPWMMPSLLRSRKPASGGRPIRSPSSARRGSTRFPSSCAASTVGNTAHPLGKRSSSCLLLQGPPRTEVRAALHVPRHLRGANP